MTKEKEKAFTGVRAKLAAHAKENSGAIEDILPASGVGVRIPKTIIHQKWMEAQKRAKNDMPKAQAMYVLSVVKFEGEMLTMADLQANLIDGFDMLWLIGKVFDDSRLSNSEGDGGNGEEGDGSRIH